MAKDEAKKTEPKAEDRTTEPRARSVDPNDQLPRALGRYLLLRRIARGGMGEVFLASTTGIEGAERPVVVEDHPPRARQAIRASSRASSTRRASQAQLQHSGVAQVLEAALDDRSGEPYAVVEHVEGRSLGDVRARAVQIGAAIGWAERRRDRRRCIAEALAHVHERLDRSGKALAIVHRDLSPQNVMVELRRRRKIIDFGTARGQNRRCHTVGGVVFAKPGYVAPEVANGDSGDARVDVYALGVMLWELCAGRRFLQGDADVHMAAVARNAKIAPADLGRRRRARGARRDHRQAHRLRPRRPVPERPRTAPPRISPSACSRAAARDRRALRPRAHRRSSWPRSSPASPVRTRREFALAVAAAPAPRPSPSARRRRPKATRLAARPRASAPDAAPIAPAKVGELLARDALAS